MKKLDECYNEIYKCSKCGLCQGVCPIFKITKNEAALSRGKFLMLLKYLEGQLPQSKTLKKYLDMCTSCGACSTFCPSGIDANKIFNLAKFEMNKYSLNFLFNSAISTLKTLKKFFTLNKYKNNSYPNNQTAILFEGCYSKCASSKTTDATLSLLDKLQINVIKPDFSCCGIVAQSLGDKKMFEQQVKNNIKILEQTNADYIIFDCATCLETVKNYDKYMDIENFDKIKEKCISVIEFLQIKNVKFASTQEQKITYHKPCHLEYDVQEVLSNIENVDYIKMNSFDKCCGFAGAFSIKNNKIAIEMLKDKAKNINETPCNTVLTFCPSCELGLKISKRYTKKKFKIMNIVEFLNGLKIISK